MTANVSKCESCGYFLIAEEASTHICKTSKAGRIEGEIFYVSDGEREYPLKISDESFQKNNRRRLPST